MIFKINLLPAKYGDALFIEYGDLNSTKKILIDGGTGGTKNHILNFLNTFPKELRVFELLVVTHIDRDHIEGILNLLNDDVLGFKIEALWFNGWNHLPGNSVDEAFGAVQGERLTSAIQKHNIAWNSHFDGAAVVVPDQGKIPEIVLEGGMKITLLSPYVANLEKLRPEWEKEVLLANLHPGFGLSDPDESEIEEFGIAVSEVEELVKNGFQEDDSAANGSSIAFIASFSGKSILLAGDSHPNVIMKSVDRLERPFIIDLAKLSHHGSDGNTSPELLKKMVCKKFAFSTNGSIYRHPSKTTIARVIKLAGAGVELFFNYTTPYTTLWRNADLINRYGYTVMYPDDEGIQINLT